MINIVMRFIGLIGMVLIIQMFYKISKKLIEIKYANQEIEE